MPTKLVDDVRALISARTEEVPLSHVERALLMTTVSGPGTAGLDVVDELDAAIKAVQLHMPVDAVRPDCRATFGRLMHAARAVLDYEPPEPRKPLAPLPEVIDQRRRADVDG